MHLRFHTAGESHGRGLVATIEGIPAGLSLEMERDVDPQLRRRQGGYGRGRRMEIESDRAELVSGVRLGETLGSPIAMLVWNRDWENWEKAMAHGPPDPDENPKALRPVYLPRPGHADLTGIVKYDRPEARDVLERASARETAARVACAAVARTFLRDLGITVGSHVVALGGVEADVPDPLPDDLNDAADRSPVRTLDPDAGERMIEAIDEAGEAGDTLGGIFEVVVRGVPVGLGSHVSWDRKLDGRLAGALMSIQAIKGVEIGLGFRGAVRPGSRVHDPIGSDPERTRGAGFFRMTNNAGGLEGGITTGEPLVVRCAMKPISTLRKPLPSVDLRTREATTSHIERSDVCALPAAGVVGEAMAALVVADAVLEKFGGDAMSEVRRNFESYLAYASEREYGRELGGASEG